MRGRLFALVGVTIILMAGVGIIQTGYRDSVAGSQPESAVDNETITVQHDSVVTLSESNRDVVYSEGATIRQNGTVYEPDGNYTWLRGNGTVEVASGSGLTDNETANVTYSYYEPASQQRLVRDVGMLPVNALGGDLVFLLGLFVFMAAFVVLMRAGGM